MDIPVSIAFLLAVAALIAGYALYGRLAERIFQPDADRPTPAHQMADGRDYIPLPGWRLFLIQLLNIAGLGPVFGPLLGALYGSISLFWIVCGCIFAGAVHDYFSGMISLRHGGSTIPKLVKLYMGNTMFSIIMAVCVCACVLGGMIFVASPAALLSSLSGWSVNWWIFLILAYYFLATILPVDFIIGKIYPFFGMFLIIMAVSLISSLSIDPRYNTIPVAFWSSHHPQNLPAWPMIFITIACGAISGGHCTQSPIIARCMHNEKNGRLLFYGAMIAEGVIALVWAMLGICLYNHGCSGWDWSQAALITDKVTQELLGPAGRVFALLGVISLAITTGDSCFRGARLILADALHIPQNSNANCLTIAIPLFAAGLIADQIGFSKLWQYFGWFNQMLAACVLWLCAIYLKSRHRNPAIALVPALFISVVIITFAFTAPLMHICLSTGVSTVLALIIAAVLGILFLRAQPQSHEEDVQTSVSPS